MTSLQHIINRRDWENKEVK
nr:beta-galactosidase leader peptide [Cloning vector pMK-RQ-BCD_LacZ-cmyc-EB2-H6]